MMIDVVIETLSRQGLWLALDALIYLAALVVLTFGGNLACRALLQISGITPPLASPTATAPTPAVLNPASPPSGTAHAPGPAPAATTTPTQTTIPATSAGAGRMIGTLERLIILLGLVAGSWEIVAAVIALKTVARFKELDERLQAEYFLIGSLASIVWAAMVSLMLMQFDRTLGFHIADVLRVAKAD